MGFNVGDLVIWKSTGNSGWGIIDEFYGNNLTNTCKVKYLYNNKKSTIILWTSELEPAIEIEVNSGVFIQSSKINQIKNMDEEKAQKELKRLAGQYIPIKEIVGFGLLQNGEIIYTKVIEKTEK